MTEPRSLASARRPDGPTGSSAGVLSVDDRAEAALSRATGLRRRRDRGSHGGPQQFERGRALTGLLMALPNTVMFAVFVLLPVAIAFVVSFFEWDIINPPEFVGLENYSRLLGDDRAHNAIITTVVIMVFATIPSIAIGFVFAILLSENVPGIRFIRLFFYMPIIVSFVAAGVVWKWIFDSQYGLANWALGVVGIDGPNWLAEERPALISTIIVIIWRNVPLITLIYVAAVTSVPQSLLDAASLDGAGWYSRARHVIWPGVRATTVLVTTVAMIGVAFSSFDIVSVMTRGGPLKATEILVFYTYETAFDRLEIGYASVLATVMFLMTFPVVALLIKFQDEPEDAS